MTLRLCIFLFMILSFSACRMDKVIDDTTQFSNTIYNKGEAWITKNDNPDSSTASPLKNIKKIKQLQRLLTQKGFNTKGVDGKIGPATRSSIKAYQKKYKLAVNGKATGALLDHIQNVDQAKNSSGSGGDNDFKIERCVSSNSSLVQSTTERLFASALQDLQVDLDSYLKGFCLPKEREKLANLYVFLVTEGVLHSRVAEIKYNELLAVYEKAGIDIALIQNSYDNSTGDKLVEDIRVLAKDRMDGATTLVKNSSQPEDNSGFQKTIQDAYNELNPNSPYKKQARQLLSEVLVHSSSSTFYLARSSYTIDQLTSYLGINASDGINILEKSIMILNQGFENYNLVIFLLSKQDDLFSMLVASSYNIKGLTQDVKDIPKPDSQVATREVREFKDKGGFTLDEMEMDFEKDNIPTRISRR